LLSLYVEKSHFIQWNFLAFFGIKLSPIVTYYIEI
jgi:hypothetical protein